MKQLLYLLFAVTFFTSCSSDDPISEHDENDTELTQDYTGLVLINGSKSNLPSVILSYYKDGIFYKIHTIKDFNIDFSAEEIVINDSYVNDLYLFISTYDTGDSYRVIEPIKIKRHIKNKFVYTSTTKAIKVNDITDSTQYPK